MRPQLHWGEMFFIGIGRPPCLFGIFHGVIEFVVVDILAGLRPRQQLQFVSLFDKQRRALSWIAGAIKCADRAGC